MSHTSRLRTLIAAILAASLCIAASHSLLAQNSGLVKLAWDPSTDIDIAGYRVHYGETSGSYDTTIDVGSKVTAELAQMPVGKTFYCAVTAYNSLGLQSDFSNEISFTVAPPAESRDSDGDGLSDHFETTYGGGADMDPLSDLDGDGLSALAEFFHGLNPNEPLTKPLPSTETIEINGEIYQCVNYTVDPLAEQFVTMRIERSTGLTPFNWEQGRTTVIYSTPSIEHPGLLDVTERSIYPMSAQRIELMRFRHDLLVTSSPLLTH